MTIEQNLCGTEIVGYNVKTDSKGITVVWYDRLGELVIFGFKIPDFSNQWTEKVLKTFEK